MDENLVKLVDECAALSRATVLESHLCRALKKTSEEEKLAGCKKYLGLYATVKENQIHPALWKEAQHQVNKNKK